MTRLPRIPDIARRSAAVVLLLASVAALAGGCIVAPLGGPYGYAAPGPVVVGPAPPVVVVRPWYRRAWW